MDDKYQVGFDGESLVREWLKTWCNTRFGQIDIMVKKGNTWSLIEVKHQESFKPPPFEGHGLPPWQIKFRMQFFKDTGIIPWLFVIEKNSSTLYCASIPDLEAGEKAFTKTGKRVIYPLSSFKRYDLSIYKLNKEDKQC